MTRYRTLSDAPPKAQQRIADAIDGKIRQAPTPIAAPPKASRAKGQHTPGVMNKLEERYSDLLEGKKQCGLIHAWEFEAVKLKLAKATFYTPDFLVLTADMEVEFHEVKGRKGDSFFAHEDAWLKLKLAVETFPYFGFVVAWQAKGGDWCKRNL